MRPFVEIDGVVFIVVGWEPDMAERERYEIRRLNPDEMDRYRENRDALDIELHAWWKLPGR
jgi:hypothetical protein